MDKNELMSECFYIAVAKFTDGERIAMTFNTEEEATDYYDDLDTYISRWTLLYYEFNQVTLIEDKIN